jgi:predicted RNase H-like HicB family nuclease
MKLHAVIHKAEEGGYWAEVPAFAGCVTQAETMPELETNLREAIEGWLLAAEPSEEPAEGELLALAV